MQTVVMEAGYSPIGSRTGQQQRPLLHTESQPDVVETTKKNEQQAQAQGDDEARNERLLTSQDSFTEYATQGRRQANGPVINRRVETQVSKRMRRRLVYKNGEVNITQTNIRKRRRRYLADIFTTLVDIKWRYNLMLFALAFILSWIIFALIWWLICFSHGDLEHYGEEDWHPCVLEIHSFTSALLFSIETQHTIGYGFRHTTENCPEAIFVMMMQSCFGVICQALMTGIVFAKLSRPKKRAETLMFSKNVCICKQDGQLCLLFRVGDMRKSHIVEAHVRAVVIKKKMTKEGETLPLFQFDVDVGFQDGRDRVFLVWPVIIVHKIDEQSPFWEIAAEDLHREQFELVVILEGIVESTGMTTQARSSYLPGEILWGQRFERLVTFQKENGQYQIDFSRFHNTIPIDTPQCSAKELAEMEPDNPDVYIDEDENTSLILSKPEKFSSPYVIKRNGVVQTDDDTESRLGSSHLSLSTETGGSGCREESETLL